MDSARLPCTVASEARVLHCSSTNDIVELCLLSCVVRWMCVVYIKLLRWGCGGNSTLEKGPPWLFVRNSRHNRFSYGPHCANANPHACREISRRREKNDRSEHSGTSPLASRIAVGRSHVRQNDPSRKNRPSPLRNLPRQLYVDRRGCVRADATLRQ